MADRSPDAEDREAVVRERQHLLNLGYRLLGSLAEAEDAVQETYARWYALSPEERAAIESPGAWLTTVASRVCLDQLKSARVRRERYVGSWLPEPLFTGASADVAEQAEREESVSLAMLVALERLNPVERAVLGYVSRLSDGVLVTTRPALNLMSARFAGQGVVRVAQEHMNLSTHRPDVRRAMLRHYGAFDALVVLTGPDRDEYRQHFRSADAVIHCGFVSAPNLNATTWQDNSDAKFWAEHTNVALCYNVCRVTLEEGVRRVVVCSSNHAADYYERLVWDGRLDMVTPEMPPRSDNWYGWAKAAYELLGFVFATGQVDGRKLEVVQWRIGGPRDDDILHVKPGDIKVMHRALGAYLSRRDQVQQAIRMVETERIEDQHGVPFLIVYGISGNTHRFWSIANARRAIGYAPEDDSQVNFADKIAAIARAARR